MTEVETFKRNVIALINRMMHEHKGRGHKDITTTVIRDWCPYCMALSDLKYKIEKLEL